MSKPKKWDSMTPEDQAAWLENNRRKERERSRKNYWSNPEKERERRRNWRKDNPDSEREQKRKRRAVNPEMEREKRRKYRAANVERELKRNREWYRKQSEALAFMQMTAAAAQLSQKQEPPQK